jgi:hypothetical protein
LAPTKEPFAYRQLSVVMSKPIDWVFVYYSGASVTRLSGFGIDRRRVPEVRREVCSTGHMS